jgi:hypothetical protein
MGRKLIVRNLPADRYQIVDIDYSEAGVHCQNCQRLIHYVAVVQSQTLTEGAPVTSDNSYRIGMDCAETLVSANNYGRFDAMFAQVKKLLTQLRQFEKIRQEHPDILDDDVKYKRSLLCYYDERWKCVMVEIPGSYFNRDRHASILCENWHKLYLPVYNRLVAMGCMCPSFTEIPERSETEKVWKNLMPKPTGENS